MKQHQAWMVLKDKITNYLFFGGGAGGGKSWLGAEWLVTNCYFYPGSKWFIGRKELKRLMASSYVTFNKVCTFHKIPREDWNLNGQYNFIEFKNGSRIDLLDLAYQPTDPMYERLGSLEYTGGWIEEAGEVDFRAFDVLKSRVGRHMNKDFDLVPKILCTMNPNKGWIYRDVYKANKNKTMPANYQFIQSLYKDNPHTSEEYGKSLSEITDKVTRQRLKDGNWEYDEDDNALMSYDDITDLFTNTVEKSNDKYLVADVARYGGDKIVIGLWKGLKCYSIKYYTKQGTETTEAIIKTLLADHEIPRSHAIADEDGIGGGVVDHIQGMKGFLNNSTPLEVGGEKQNFQNLKTQCAYELARNIKLHKISVDCEDTQVKEWIVEELEQIKRKDADNDGKLKIISKDEVKELIGRSPDFSDMLLMRMWFELKPKMAPNQFGNNVKKAFI